MKIRNLSWFLGLNVAAACVLMQGCKANKAHMGNRGAQNRVVVVDPEPATPEPVKPAPAPAPAPTPAPAPDVQVRDVKPLPPPPPPPPAKPEPKAKPAPAAPATAANLEYKVEKGDTLSKISKKYNVKMGAIIAANPGIDPNRIRIGQKLSIPGATAEAPASADKKPAPAAANVKAPEVKQPQKAEPYKGPTKDYTVKSGDTLGHIALANGTTVRTIKELNGLSKDTLAIGQKLKLPAAKQEKPAAKKAEPAKTAETPKPAPAAPAEPAKQPDEKPAADAAPATPAPATVDVVDALAAESKKEAPAAGAVHVVKEGEDLLGISIDYGLSPSQLMDLNNIAPGEALKPGTALKLPAGVATGE